MVDFPKPVDPFKHVKVDRVEEKPREYQKKAIKPQSVSKKTFLYLTFLNVLKSAFKIFSNGKKPQNIKKTPLEGELKALKSSLQALKTDNLSQNPNFLNQLAFVWLKFLKDFNFFILKDKEITEKIKKLIHGINTYPKGSEFSLGYYLSKFAGYKWVPFPFMEILQDLFLEHQKDNKTSNLQKWTTILEDLLKRV